MPETHTPKLVILGSSSGSASAHRAASAYLLDLGSRGILIDCGDGATGSFLAAGYEPDWVSDIFISHTHADHVGGLPYFIQQRYLSGTDNPLTIHCPTEAIEPLQALFRFGYLFDERMPFTIHYEGLVAEKTYAPANIAVTPYPTTHLSRHASFAAEHGYPNRGECFAFRIVVNERSIVYSADLGSLADLSRITEPIDWLLVETTHVDPNDLWPWAAAMSFPRKRESIGRHSRESGNPDVDSVAPWTPASAGVTECGRGIRRIILTHLADDFDTGVTAAAAKYTSAEIVIAEDGMILPIV